MPDTPVDVVARVARALDELGVPYLVGGSLASSAHGVARTTNDVDLVVDLRREHVRPLVRKLETEFYVDADVALDAVRRGASFNLIHFDMAFKVDIFVAGSGAFERTELARRRTADFDGTRLSFATPEDTLLAKLRWYRDGGCVSERQWRDVLGIVRTQADALDREYLREWAERLGVTDLLGKALSR